MSINLITLDLETYYDKKDFSLSKMTTESYVRDPRFEVIGLGIKLNDGPTQWASGDHDELKEFLGTFPWEDAIVVCHNTMFDGAVLAWHFDINPRIWADTLSIGRALHGVDVGGSLASLSERYGIGVKGTEVQDANGKRRSDFTEDELARYGDYCINDVELTYKLFALMSRQIPTFEMRLIDLTLRMYIHPVLDLDLEHLENHLHQLAVFKQDLLDSANVKDKKDLMSNDKFADLLRKNGVAHPPMKTSAHTGKQIYAFAKTDEGMRQLAEHEDVRVQALVAARLGNKSTLEETRTQRFIDIAHRGLLPAPVKYYAAHTGRWGGTDKINLQNLPSRGPNGKVLKKAIIPPKGYTLIDADSSQIEARVLAWWAEQNDLVEDFQAKRDVYKKMASAIYNKPQDEIDAQQRFIGKTTILGAGYGMGAAKFKDQTATMGVELDENEARRIIKVYRSTNTAIRELWYDCNNMLQNMVMGKKYLVGRFGVLGVDPTENALVLPTGVKLRYNNLRADMRDDRFEFFYKARAGETRIYGGKVVENVCQALARIIIGYQMLKINKKYKVAMTVHDSIVCCVPDEQVDEAVKYIAQCMRSVPDWAKGLPIDCEVEVGKSYGDTEKVEV